MVPLAVWLLAAGACSTPRQPAASGEVTTTTTTGPTEATLTFSDSGCAYDGPGAVPAGPLTIHVVNAMPADATPVVVYTALLSIAEGHTYDDLVDWVAEGHPTPPRWVTTVDDGESSPGETDQLKASVTAGTYGIVCATPHEPDGSISAAGSFAVTA
jgi:hypothetical protein